MGFGPYESDYEVLGLTPVPPDVQSNKAQVVTIRNLWVQSLLSNAETVIVPIDCAMVYFTLTRRR